MKRVILSGANINSGGPLEIYKQILNFFAICMTDVSVIAIVNDVKLFEKLKNVEYIEIPSYKMMPLLKFYFEYFRYLQLSKRCDIDLWLSLNDCSPRVRAKCQAVYCHNATPFYKRSNKDFLQPTRVLFQSFYYHLFYRINIKSNDFVIVQQNWLKEYFSQKYLINKGKIIIHNDQVSDRILNHSQKEKDSKFIFIYPTKAQPYKNIEIICEAAKLVINKDFKLIITINESDSAYAKRIVSKYKMVSNIEFVGYLSKDKLDELYESSDCLVFSSKLETWGLPISEYKNYSRPIILANLPYARETIGNYTKAKFFNPSDAKELAMIMESVLDNSVVYDFTEIVEYAEPHAKNWSELFNILIPKNV